VDRGDYYRSSAIVAQDADFVLVHGSLPVSRMQISLPIFEHVKIEHCTVSTGWDDKGCGGRQERRALMATGYTQLELDTLLAILDETAPQPPSKLDKLEAPRVTALRIAITDKGAFLNLETKGGELNVWAAKEMAGAISLSSDEYGWSKKKFKPEPSDHLKEPMPTDLEAAAGVHSLATHGEPSGLLVRFAIGNPIKHRTLFFPRTAALEVMIGIGKGGTIAKWWNPDDDSN
jgi:hypothetical protein